MTNCGHLSVWLLQLDVFVLARAFLPSQFLLSESRVQIASLSIQVYIYSIQVCIYICNIYTYIHNMYIRLHCLLHHLTSSMTRQNWRLAPDLRNVCVENAHLAVRQPYVPGRSRRSVRVKLWWSTKKWDCVHLIYDINGRLMETGKKN